MKKYASSRPAPRPCWRGKRGSTALQSGRLPFAGAQVPGGKCRNACGYTPRRSRKRPTAHRCARETADRQAQGQHPRGGGFEYRLERYRGERQPCHGARREEHAARQPQAARLQHPSEPDRQPRGYKDQGSVEAGQITPSAVVAFHDRARDDQSEHGGCADQQPVAPPPADARRRGNEPIACVAVCGSTVEPGRVLAPAGRPPR